MAAFPFAWPSLSYQLDITKFMYTTKGKYIPHDRVFSIRVIQAFYVQCRVNFARRIDAYQIEDL